MVLATTSSIGELYSIIIKNLVKFQELDNNYYINIVYSIK